MPCFLAIDFYNLILLYYTTAEAKARVTGTRETFLPKARSDSRLCYFKQKKIMNKRFKKNYLKLLDRKLFK